MIAIIGGVLLLNVLVKSSFVLAVIIFAMSGLFEMYPWNPSIKITSRFWFSKYSITLSSCSMDAFVFSMIAISSGEMATVILLPAWLKRHVLVPSLSMVKLSR